MREISFHGTSKNDLRAFPSDARGEAGYQLSKVQHGLEPSDWKPMLKHWPWCLRDQNQRRKRPVSDTLCCQVCRCSPCSARLSEKDTTNRQGRHRIGQKALQRNREDAMTETFKSVWDALETDPAERESMKIKSRLMMDIESCIKKQGMTQKQSAKKMGVTQPRISDLVRGKINRFTIDMLVNMLARLGKHVDVTLRDAA